MKTQQLAPDLFLATGDTLLSLSLVVTRDDEALLIDTLASTADAAELRRFVENDLGKRVAAIVCTHYMNDHMAGLPLFPDAEVIAHELYMHTYLSQASRSAEEDSWFVKPTITFDGKLSMRWGAYALTIFHNPGHTMSSVAVDVPEADLLVVSDTIVGNIAYISYSAPDVLRAAIDRLQARPRRRFVIPGHLGTHDWTTLGNARAYLDALESHVRSGRDTRAIAIEECLVAGIAPNDFERYWHDRNLELIASRYLFTLSR